MHLTLGRVGLALSGGGFRATLFSLGALWRLNDLGLLRNVDRVTSVSGGSITAGLLACKWGALAFAEPSGAAPNFQEVIAHPLIQLCSRTLDVPSFIYGLLLPSRSPPLELSRRYAAQLYGSVTLQELPVPPAGPEFIFYATSLQTGSSVRLGRTELHDYKIGCIRNPRIPLSIAVAASTAFPPFFSPLVLRTSPTDWVRTEYSRLYDRIDFRRRVVLTDGGVYDNLGLEAIWKGDFDVVIACDAGAPFEALPRRPATWFDQLLRVQGVMQEQQRALRRRVHLERLIAHEKKPLGGYAGAYFGLSTHIDDFGLEDAMVRDNECTARLASIRTRLATVPRQQIGYLVNWGYALADAAVRRYVVPGRMPSPSRWPIPEHPLAL